jgi:hypothetical protein
MNIRVYTHALSCLGILRRFVEIQSSVYEFLWDGSLAARGQMMLSRVLREDRIILLVSTWTLRFWSMCCLEL